MTMSKPAVPRFGHRAARRGATGSSSPAGSCTRTPACLPTTYNCSIAAGRRTSVDTSSGWRPCFASQRPSLPEVVVLPDPCRPSSRMTRGAPATAAGPPACRRTAPASRRARSARPAGPASGSSGLPDRPARSRTRSMNALTTLKLTSASSSASRISRSAASTVCSVEPGFPRSERKTPCRRSLRDSNM